ncbi:hypothetical protein Agabi119p4_989 [Agaricus bisporus var. burnettii]|uniref:Golgi to ER traffic protein 2 n=1 Tax=Agaricus bisporus var. burnettii TaxID=192524 RepID=A0A8H7KLN7_AGABI|nr:hypothetical protein Agabi119p4_989 [Agaricus bisporus var. burnettii]
MSSAAERAEARRKAILAKRGDRLAKLTTTARGDEASFLNDDSFSFSKSLPGEEPPRHSVSPSPVPTSRSPPTNAPASSVTVESLVGDTDESVWSTELQEQIWQALMNASATRPSLPSSRVPSGTSAASKSSDPRGPSPGPFVGGSSGSDQANADPFAELLTSFSGAQTPGSDMFDLLQQMRQGGAQSSNPETETLKRDKAIRNLVQLVSTWLLLAYFVFFLEPAAYTKHVGSLDVGRWTRWAVLGQNRNMLELLPTFKVEPQPAFFWAFAALESAIQFNNIRKIFSSQSNVQSPFNAFGRVAQVPRLLGTAFGILNSLGSVVFGLGFIVFLASFATPK